MIKYMLGLVGVFLLLVGCGGERAVEETAVLPTIKPTAVQALATVVPAATGETEMDTNENEMSHDAGEVVVGTAVSSGSVDLSQLTPAPPAEPGEPREMPAPGVPNPLLKLQNEVAQDLSQQLGIDISEIEQVQVTSTEWRDGSLGCPQPGRMYTMALVSGYQIVLRAQGEQYIYHTNGTSSFILCPQATPLAGLDK